MTPAPGPVGAGRSFAWRQLTTPPNLLSLARVPLGLLAWVAPASTAWLVGLLVVATVTDLLDGWLARRAGGAAESFGAWLDPFCDKCFVVSVASAVWMALGPPWWLAALALVREGLLALLLTVRFAVPALRRRRFPTRSLWLGKLTTTAQFALLAAVAFGWREAWTAVALTAAALGFAAAVQYGLRALRTLRGTGEPVA